MNQSTLTRGLLAFALVSASGALGACAHEPSAVSPPRRTASLGATMAQPTATIPEAESSYGPQSPMVPGGWGLPPDVSGLDDAQLAGVVQAIHQADVEHLQLALTRASSPDVTNFARDAIQVQRTAASQDDADLAQLAITPSISPLSQQVLSDWQRDRSELQASAPAEFDREFTDHHVTRDTRAVALLDAAIDRVRSPSLKGQLQADRTTMAGHLRESQRVQLLVRSRGE